MTTDRVYYALESLPQVIGDRQFRLVVDALGLTFDGGTSEMHAKVVAMEIETRAARHRSKRKALPAFEGIG